MSSKDVSTRPILLVEGQRQVLIGLMLLWFASLVLQAIFQTKYFDPFPSLDLILLYRTKLVFLIHNSIVFSSVWIMAIVTCLRGVNKIKKDTDEVVLYVSAIGSLFGLAIVVLCQGGEVGFWGWIAGVGWPVVALTTAVGLTTIMAFPRGSGFGSGSSEQERMARAAEQRKIAQQQEQQRAMVNYRILYEQPMTSQRKIELCDGVVSQSAVPLKDGNIVKHKKDTAMQFAAAGKQLGIATMEMDFEQMEGGKKMNTAFMQVQAVIKKKEAALSDSDSWVDLKRSKGGKSE